MRLRGCWHVSGPSTRSSSREPYDRIRPYLAVFVQPNTATARTIPAVKYTIWGADGTATAAVQNGRTPVAYGTARSPKEAGRRRDLVWLLDLSGQSQVTPSKWHPQLVLREPDIQDEAELRFVWAFSAGLFEVGEHLDESGGKRDWLDIGYAIWA